MIAEPEALLAVVMAGATHADSCLHGLDHWRIVARNGLELAAVTPGADPLVAVLFGLFHDAKRLDDGEDPDHGPRAGVFVREVHATGLFRLSPERLDRLVVACSTHTVAMVSDDPTLGVCYDADRLDLWRVGIEPRPMYLSTPAARDPLRIAQGEVRDLELEWQHIFRTLREWNG
jgi:uncharacterized protein